MARQLIAIMLTALALPLMAAPALAQGKGVNCMHGAYTDAQRSELAALGPGMTISDDEIEDAAFDQIGNIAMTAIESCIGRNGWNQEQAFYATLYEMGRLNEAAYRGSGQLSAEQLRLLDDALATGNRDRLWQVIEAGVIGGIGDSGAEVSDGDAMILGVFLISAGLDVEGEDEMVAEKVGILLGFMGLQRFGRREFTNLN